MDNETIRLVAWDAAQAVELARLGGLTMPQGEPGQFWGFVAWQGELPLGYALCRVNPGSRRAGILLETGQQLNAAGQSQLLQALTCRAPEQGLSMLTLDLAWQQHPRPELEGTGLFPWFTTSHMVYRGGKLPQPELPFFPYEDSWYRPFQRLQSRAFVPLRRENDVEPYALQPSVQDRIWCAQNRQDIFLLKGENGLAAAGYAGGRQLDLLAVDQAYRGQGYGKALVAYGVNHLLDRGETPRLEVLDWNQPAQTLYRRMGFETEQQRQLFRWKASRLSASADRHTTRPGKVVGSGQWHQ